MAAREPATPSRSNADFRRLLATPRPARESDRSSSSSSRSSNSRVFATPSRSNNPQATPKRMSADDRKKRYTIQKPAKQYFREEDYPEEGGAAGGDGTKKGKDASAFPPGYRDRAAERRSGANPDYAPDALPADHEQENTHLPIGVTADAGVNPLSALDPDAASSAEEQRKRAIEESKFLGGDVEHTHLVKGLDFALLSKIRSEMSKEEKEKQEQEEEHKRAEQIVQKAKEVLKQNAPKAVKFETALGRSIHETLFLNDEETEEHTALLRSGAQAPNSAQDGDDRLVWENEAGQSEFIKRHVTRSEALRARVVDTFIKGRTTYVFDITNRPQRALPTTTMRIKEDCPQGKDRMTGRIDPALGSQIANIMSSLRSNPSKRLTRKRGAEEAVQAKVEQPVDNVMSMGFMKPAARQPVRSVVTDEDDIFAGVGADYICAPSKEQEEITKKLQEETERMRRIAQSTKEKELEEESEEEEEEDMEEETQDAKPLKRKREEAVLPQVKQQPQKKPHTMSLAEELAAELEAEKALEAQEEQGPVMPGPGPVAPSDESYDMAYPDTDAQYGDVEAYPNTDDQYGDIEAYPNTDDQYATEAPKPAVSAIVVQETEMSEQEKRDRGSATVFRRDASLSRRKETDKREKEASFVSENYSECYPGSYESAFKDTVQDDSDEDDDFSKMDMGTRARKKVRPWHFESDAAWTKYNDELEATPKAAYQFGVKMADGRKKGNLKQVKRTEDAKLNRQLQQVNNFLKQKPQGPSSS